MRAESRGKYSTWYRHYWMISKRAHGDARQLTLRSSAFAQTTVLRLVEDRAQQCGILWDTARGMTLMEGVMGRSLGEWRRADTYLSNCAVLLH